MFTSIYTHSSRRSFISYYQCTIDITIASSSQTPNNGDVFNNVADGKTSTTLSDHHHTSFNVPVDVTSFIKSIATLVAATVAAVILVGLISLAILLLVIMLIRRARRRGGKNITNIYEYPDAMSLRAPVPVPGDDLHQRYHVIILLTTLVIIACIICISEVGYIIIHVVLCAYIQISVSGLGVSQLW